MEGASDADDTIAAENDGGLGVWMEIISPDDGATVANPVVIRFNVSAGVDWVTFEADGWPLGQEPVPAEWGSLSYTFSGTGYERHLVATALNGKGDPVAEDTTYFTVGSDDSDEQSDSDTDSDASALVFPIDIDGLGSLYLSHYDSALSTGSFGAARSGGRAHGGCDLYWTDDDGYAYVAEYYPYNRKAIYAVADGVVTDFYDFYQGTNALVVDHGDFTVRYGEVDAAGLPNGLGVGSKVFAGQHVADMGNLQMSTGYWSMLHFEVFSGEVDGPLTDRENWTYLHVEDRNYQRRRDLLDCAQFLNAI